MLEWAFSMSTGPWAANLYHTKTHPTNTRIAKTARFPLRIS